MRSAQLLWSDFPALQLVRTGRMVRLAGKLTFVALVVSISAMMLLPWRQTAQGVGNVVALDPQNRPQPVMSPAKGVVSYVKPGLREGSFVEQGEVVLRMTPFAANNISQLETQIATSRAKVEAYTLAKSNAEMNKERQEDANLRTMESLEEELNATKAKWEQALSEVGAVEADLRDKQRKFEVDRAVATRGLVPDVELNSSREAYEAAKQKLAKARQYAEEGEANYIGKQRSLEAKKGELDIKLREAEQKVLKEQTMLQSALKELSELENKRDEFNRLEVQAPRSGYIQQWYGLAGSDTVKEGDQLFVIVPDAAELAVEMKVSGNDMPLVSEGDHVRLQFEGWPAVQFVGWPSVAVGTFGGKVNRVFPTDDGLGNFRVVVTPEKNFAHDTDWPDRRYLRQGVRANGWVLLRRVKLGYEIWRQLNGFPPVVASEEPKEKLSKVPLPK
ncbi:HlyD family secretion protein [Crateriforma conspicua]|uniref:Type I secretion system membrane fusion protein PrsE n=1 Tax=Crateriforma conspicua TaxID=2527996 RepID=A0A5C5Y1K9_9PLAN|nr:HlyD family efflux transporter periplasmic adaptor subunit [Crateriforma conspicua]QDV63722.1 Type I secretion system membrane fusion protein PrsE [Crateriforma conspicua]TWT69104.1 Type I secretion system membrane fusion protein PrsE [Crateriforma conspicua]